MSESNGRATIREVYELVSRIEAKIDQFSEKTESRFDRLERWRAWMTGVGVTVSFGLSLALALMRFV